MTVISANKTERYCHIRCFYCTIANLKRMDIKNIQIRETTGIDLESIVIVQKSAFKTDEEARLTVNLLDDETARPLVSLLALDGTKPVGHILFTKARVEGYHKAEHVYILAPLAVVSEYQKQGIGGLLIKEGLQKLKEKGTEMVFVLGDPDYYRKHGFIPEAASFGFLPPLPVPERYAEAWMVQPLTIKGLSKSAGKVVCAEALNRAEYWQE